MVRSKSALDHAIPLSFHSDLPMGPASPLNFIWCAVNRMTPSGRVAGPEQRIGVDDALRAVTIQAAYSWRQEDRIGSIAPGKIANFAVLEGHPHLGHGVRGRPLPSRARLATCRTEFCDWSSNGFSALRRW